MQQQELIKEYLDRFPESPTMTLAKLIYKEHPLLFTDLERCRSAIRYQRGNFGADGRKRLSDKAHIRENGAAGWTAQIPASIAKKQEPYIIPDGKTIILSDIHMPYHDDLALDVAMEYADEYEPDNILINGDLGDFFACSKWENNPEERHLKDEIESCRAFLAHLRERFPEANIIYKLGNHEERWNRYLWVKAQELVGCKFVSYESIFGLDESNVVLVNSRNKIKIGEHLTIIHGHELRTSAVSPVNFARTMQMNMNVCAIGGHMHQTTEHVQKNADDDLVSCWSVGCLCDMTPDYAIINKWNHGFLTVQHKGNDFDVQNKRILNSGIIR
jgi:predicted phosphodiesterase